MLEIIHNHKDWIIVNKPAGISMQQEQGENENLSLLQLALQACQHVDNSIGRLWPVHRLDKATSGLVIFAKSATAAATFGELFSSQQIQKSYLAIALGKPKKKQGWIKGDMEKGRNGSWLLKRSLLNPAHTYFQSYALVSGDETHSSTSTLTTSSLTKRLYLISPKTGKTHQIRVALKSLGCPILGDTRYKGEKSDRCYLHAFCLIFNWQGEELRFLADPKQGNWPELSSIELLSEFFIQ